MSIVIVLDPGFKNLALVVAHDKEVVSCIKMEVTFKSAAPMVINYVLETLTSLDPTSVTIVYESQLEKNISTRKLCEYVVRSLGSYLVSSFHVNVDSIPCNPWDKYDSLAWAGLTYYKKYRKSMSFWYCKQLALQERIILSPAVRTYVESLSKKDDVSDCMLMLHWYKYK